MSPPTLDQVVINLLFSRLFLPSIILAIVAVVVAGVVSDQALRRQQIERATLLAGQVGAYVDDAVHVMQSLASFSQKESNFEHIQLQLNMMWEAYGFFDSLEWLSPDGHVLRRVPEDLRYVGLDMSNQEYYLVARGHPGATLSRPFISSATGLPVVTISLLLENGELLVGELNLVKLQKETENLGRIASSEELFILDDKGTLLAHPDSELVAQRVSYPELIEQGSTSNTRLWLYTRRLPGEAAGTLMLATVARDPRTGWIVVAQVPLADAYGAVRWSIAFLLVAMPLIWMILLVYMRNRFNSVVIQPLSRFNEAVRQLAQGRTGSGVLTLPMSATFLEMGSLIENFSHMSRAVLEREQALRSERDLVLSILECAPDAVLIAELDGTLTDCNSAAVDIFAAGKRGELVGRNYYDLIFPEDFALARQGERTLQTEGALRDAEYRFKTLNGRPFPGAVSIGLIRDSSGRGAGFVATVRDITGRKQAEDELRQSEEKFRTFMEQSSDGIVLVDEMGIIIELNQSFERMTGIRREALLGRYAWEALVQFSALDGKLPERQEKLRRLVMRAIQEGVSPILYQTMDAQIEQADGSQRIIQQILFPIRTHSGFRLGATFRDITERRQMEERLQASLAEKDVLLREVHHRVKNNFGVIIGLLGLQSRYIQDQAIQELFVELQERIRSMSLIHEKLYQSRELARVDFGAYVREMVSGLGQMFGTRTAAIRLVVEVEDVVLGVDMAIPCGLIINELVTNALKYAFPNGSSGEVRIGFRPEGEDWILTVSDNGAGLPAEHADLESPHSFGLRLIRILTEQLEGSLEVDTSRGTAYTIRFRQEG